MQEFDYRTDEHKETDDVTKRKPKMAINSDTEEDDSDEDDEIRAAKKAIYARNYMKRSMAEERVLEDSDEEFDSESDY